LEEYSTKFDRLLFIVDNVQKSLAARSLFKVFNYFSSKKDLSTRIRFLFAARKGQLNNVIESDSDLNREFSMSLYSQSLKEMPIAFTAQEASIFLKKALEVSNVNVLPEQLLLSFKSRSSNFHVCNNVLHFGRKSQCH
jgi:hypothetical protein